jgi:hypothetical protein
MSQESPPAPISARLPPLAVWGLPHRAPREGSNPSRARSEWKVVTLGSAFDPDGYYRDPWTRPRSQYVW